MLAGFLGALTGLGGGVVIVPVLCLIFKIDLHYAIGASLVSVIATSSGAAAAYVRDGYSNIRIGMFLEVATTLGALLGAYLVARVSANWIGIVFGVVLLYSAWTSLHKSAAVPEKTQKNALAMRLNLRGSYPVQGGKEDYVAEHVPAGFGIMFIAGTLSGLLGIGSGAVKVLAMDQIMKLPFKVSTTTSNFMIGVTAAASAGVYLSRGYILPGLAMPVILGVLAGSLAGSRVLIHAEVKTLRWVFAAVIVGLGGEMIFNGLTGRLQKMRPTDQRLEIAMGQMLRIGVTVAALVVLTGGILYLLQASGPLPDYSHFHRAAAVGEHFGSIFSGALHFESKSLIEFGILLLIATPICRVVFGVVGFSLLKDWLYAGVSTIVLTILLLSFFTRR